MADLQLQLAETVRHRFCVPVVIGWIDAEGKPTSASGVSVDVSVYGLQITMPVRIPADTKVTINLNGVAIVGHATVRHSQSCREGFRVGVHFDQTLFMQKVPGLDEILNGSFYSASTPSAPSLFWQLRRRLGLLLLGARR